MAWYPGARKMELQPESDSQPEIDPDQLIFHSIAAPWTKERIFEYWRDSTNLESHFGQSYDGSIAQYIGTETRADANYLANRRPSTCGAISIETASNLEHTDPWTDAQVAGLIALGVWVHKTHYIPLRICRTWDDPGFGYHGMFPGKWSPSGTACPGPARIKQFRDVVFPGIVKAATAKPAPAPSTGERMDYGSFARTTDLVIPAGATRQVNLDEEYADGAADHGDGGRTFLVGAHYSATAHMLFADPLPAGVYVRFVREQSPFTGNFSGDPAVDLVSGTRRAAHAGIGVVQADERLQLEIVNASSVSVTLQWAGVRSLSQAL